MPETVALSVSMFPETLRSAHRPEGRTPVAPGRGTVRTVELLDIPVQIAIAHGHLSPDERVEDSDVSLERLLFSLRVTLRGPRRVSSGHEGFKDILNYAPIHEYLMALKRTAIDCPIETLVDDLVEVVERASPEFQISGKVRLISLEAWVVRPDLVDGEVRTSITRHYETP